MANLEVDQAFLSGVAYGKQSLCEDLRQRLGQLRLGYRGQRALRPILADLGAHQAEATLLMAVSYYGGRIAEFAQVRAAFNEAIGHMLRRYRSIGKKEALVALFSSFLPVCVYCCNLPEDSDYAPYCCRKCEKGFQSRTQYERRARGKALLAQFLAGGGLDSYAYFPRSLVRARASRTT